VAEALSSVLLRATTGTASTAFLAVVALRAKGVLCERDFDWSFW
jgi:hypothetical protein